jgi:hypothetical protein
MEAREGVLDLGIGESRFGSTTHFAAEPARLFEYPHLKIRRRWWSVCWSKSQPSSVGVPPIGGDLIEKVPPSCYALWKNMARDSFVQLRGDARCGWPGHDHGR